MDKSSLTKLANDTAQPRKNAFNDNILHCHKVSFCLVKFFLEISAAETSVLSQI